MVGKRYLIGGFPHGKATVKAATVLSVKSAFAKNWSFGHDMDPQKTPAEAGEVLLFHEPKGGDCKAPSRSGIGYASAKAKCGRVRFPNDRSVYKSAL